MTETVAWILRLCCIATVARCVRAQQCGNFFTSQCRADYDVRYNPNVPVDLQSQAKAWSKIPGFYQGKIYQYNTETFEPISETEFFDTDAGKNQYMLSPSRFYLNITVNGTKAYRHSYQIMAGRFGIESQSNQIILPGGVVYCDGWSVATWEKNGTAQNIKSVCGLNEAYNIAKITTDVKLLEGSLAYPMAGDEESGVLFVEKFHANDDPLLPVRQLETSYLCTNEECSLLAVKMETFENGQRTEFHMGNVQRVQNATDFQELITQDYAKHTITERDQVKQPMPSACLNAKDCATTKEFCTADPSCTVTPYQEPEADVKTGAIVTLVFGIVAFFLLLVALLYVYLTNRIRLRYRQFFAKRMAETMAMTDKPLMEFTPEELADEYKVLCGHCNDEINKDNLYEFLSLGRDGYMDYGDFEALWLIMNCKRTGTVDFLEFSSIMAHCHKELEEAKQSLVEGGNTLD